MPVKRLIDARRRRKSPPRGFGWIDHRLLRDGYLGRCSTESLALYVLLVCASDAQGLSYYSDARMAEILGLEPAILHSCRRQLIGLGLIADQKPLYQLLSLEEGLEQERAKGGETEEPNEQKLPPGTVPTRREISLKAMVEKLLEQQRSGALEGHDQL